MDANDVNFNNLPKAVAYLISEIAELKLLLSNHPDPAIPIRIPIGINEVSQLIGKAKSTIYTLVRNRKIPCYKNGNKLYFFKDEILEWISCGRRKTLQEIDLESKSNFKRNYKI
jgi:excisionase family DNA binding protein